VAPTSWFTVGHVNDGREHINFSKWLLQPEKKRQEIKKEMIEEIEKGNMPLPPYLITHSNVEVTEEKLHVLKS